MAVSRSEVVDPNGSLDGLVRLAPNFVFDNVAYFRPPINKADFVDEAAIVPLLDYMTVSLRRLIQGAKLFALCERRDNVTCDDINAFVKFQHQKPLYGFMEDERWFKIGEIIMPQVQILNTDKCEASIDVEGNQACDLYGKLLFANRKRGTDDALLGTPSGR